jgi:hypothetical protein
MRYNTEIFIEKATKKHNNRYDYSKVIYKDSSSCVKIICKKHGEFLQIASEHLRGRGCPYCCKTKKLTIEKFIERGNQIHNNKYDYSKSVYVNTSTKLIIICKKHGEFLQTPNRHLNNKQGCPYCNKKRKLTTEEFIKRSKKVHGNRYDYSKVNYKNYNTKVKIICKEHGEFLQFPGGHLSGRGCFNCGGSKKSNTEGFIKKAKEVHEVHGDKYDYSKVDYKNAITKVIIICKEHGEFLQTPSGHLSGHGCYICGQSRTSNTEEFIKKANKKHNNKYDYNKVDYKNIETKVIIICKKHGEFLQTPHSHLKGFGCYKCGGTKRLTTEEFIEKAKKVHGDKYNYSKVDYNGRTKSVKIICKEHGEFVQKPRDHLDGCGCQICGNSRGENLLINILGELYGKEFCKKRADFNINPETGSKLEYDCYCEELKIAVEYQGLQHYKYPNKYHKTKEEFKDQINRDNIKRKNSKEHGIKLIEIKEFGHFNRKNIMNRMFEVQKELGFSKKEIKKAIRKFIKN